MDDSDEWAALVREAAEAGNAAPAARRAAAGMAPGPRELTDEEAGVDSGPQLGNAPGQGVGGYPGRPTHTTDPMEVDTTAQNVVGSVVGGGAGKLAGAVAGKAGPVIGKLVGGATEGAVGAGVQGVNPAVGALFGAGMAVPGAAGEYAAGAPARVAERTLKNITEEGTPTRIANQVEAKAGAEGEVLDQVMGRHPELRRALALTARSNPEASLEPVQHTLHKLNAYLDPAYEAMDAHAATLPPSSQATVSQLLDHYDGLLNKYKGDLDKTRAITAARSEIVREFGDKPGTVIAPSELRNLKASIGRAAFSGDPAAPATVKAQVTRELYGPIAHQIDRIAELTPGVDHAEFKAANRDTSVLIPVSQALEKRAAREATGKESLFHRAKEWGEKLGPYAVLAAPGLEHLGFEHGGKMALATGAVMGARSAGRHLDYALANIMRSRAETGAVPVSIVQQAVHAGVPVQVAVAAARGELPPMHIPGLGGLGGRPATAEDSPYPALHKAIEAGDHEAGKAALAAEVFRR